MQAAKASRRPLQSPAGKMGEARRPMPIHLMRAGYDHTVNVAVLGVPGAGSSSLVNALRLKGAADDLAAPVGSTRTTMKPAAYPLCDKEDDVRYGGCFGPGTAACVRLWDLPGVPATMGAEGACRDLGLSYYDAVLLVCSRRVSPANRELSTELARWDVPHFMVRTKVDVDVRAEEHDHGLAEGETLEMVRGAMAELGLGDAFMVSARAPQRFELQRLCMNVLATVNARRQGPEAADGACAVCGMPVVSSRYYACISCEAAVCASCFAAVAGAEDEAHCPRCNRPAALHCTWSWWAWLLPFWRTDLLSSWLWLLS